MAFWTASAAILLVLAYFVLESKALSEPITKCYVLDRENYLYDFTSLKGQVFTHSLQESSSTFTLRLCQDVFVSSSSGGELVNFGKFRPDYLFSPSTDVKFSFEQGYTYGELHGCRDHGFDLSGRSTLVRITCDKCPDGSTCADASAGGCICSVEYDSTSKCSIAVVLALKCGASLGRVYKGLSVGQGPRTHEVVRDGLTQWGYESTAHADYSFTTGESEHFLYLSALSATASLLPVPSFSVSPSKGLEVKLAGSAATGAAATVESPSVLKVYWRCNKVRAEPYQVEVSLAIEAHAPVTFLLAKHCSERGVPAAQEEQRVCRLGHFRRALFHNHSGADALLLRWIRVQNARPGQEGPGCAPRNAGHQQLPGFGQQSRRQALSVQRGKIRIRGVRGSRGGSRVFFRARPPSPWWWWRGRVWICGSLRPQFGACISCVLLT